MDPTKLPHSMNPLPSDRFMPNLPTLTKADSTEVGTLLSTTCTDVLLHKSVKKMQEESRGQHCIVLSTIGNQAEADPTENPSQPKRKRKPDLIDDFFKRFVCGRLAQLYPDLVTLIKENEYLVLKFNDIDKIGSSYCDFKELTTGKELRRKPERTKDRFRRFMKDLENKGLLEKVGDGKEYGKLFLKYAVKKTELWDLLKEKYTVQENATMVIWKSSKGEHATVAGIDQPLTPTPFVTLQSRVFCLAIKPSVRTGIFRDMKKIPESPPVTNNVISNEASPYTKESPDSWKWERKSMIHRDKFKKLFEEGRQHPENVKMITGVRVCCSKDFLIDRGVEGTRVYIGLGIDGVEKAVKRLPKDACTGSAEQEKKVLNRAKSQYVVNYWFLDENSDPEYLYLILDLCEENLERFLEKNSSDDLRKIAPEIIRQVLKGLQDLHGGEMCILHRDIKPSNILRSAEGKWLLADFGISRFLPGGASTHLSDQKGTKHWRAVESYPAKGGLNDGQVRYKKESDIQVTGMVAFYIVTKGQHVFGEEADRLRNLMDGNPVGLKMLKDLTLKDLLSWMVSHTPESRPAAEEALKHPYLQSTKNQFEMLCAVGNQPEIKKIDVNSDVVRKLNNDPTDWRKKLLNYILNYLCTDRSTRRLIKYSQNWTDCLRLMRNVKQHWNDRPMDPILLNAVGDPQEYFLTQFPNLPVRVHQIVRSCDWKERTALKEFFK